MTHFVGHLAALSIVIGTAVVAVLLGVAVAAVAVAFGA